MRQFLLIALCGLVLTSCQKELSFDMPVNPPDPTPGGGSGVCFTCDYLPICDNSKFDYIDTLMGTPTNVTTILNLLGDTTINGASWKKVKDAGTGQRLYTNCNNSVVKLFVPTATSTGGTTISNVIQTPVKGNEVIGATWKDVILNQLGQTVEYRYTLVAKNLTRQVYDSTYTNVIYVRDTTVLIAPGLPEIASVVRHSYWARGIGTVEVRTEDVMMGSLMMVRKLKSYRL